MRCERFAVVGSLGRPRSDREGDRAKEHDVCVYVDDSIAEHNIGRRQTATAAESSGYAIRTHARSIWSAAAAHGMRFRFDTFGSVYTTTMRAGSVFCCCYIASGVHKGGESATIFMLNGNETYADNCGGSRLKMRTVLVIVCTVVGVIAELSSK